MYETYFFCHNNGPLLNILWRLLCTLLSSQELPEPFLWRSMNFNKFNHTLFGVHKNFRDLFNLSVISVLGTEPKFTTASALDSTLPPPPGR